MYAITAVTGRVGGATALALLAADVPVRAVVRTPAAAQIWSELGAEVACADFTDQAALTRAFSGCSRVFVMLPTITTASDTDHRRMGDSIAAAVAASAVPHVVALSSIGADLPDGTGPIRWLHHLEHRLQATGAVVSAIRSPHFQEKVEAVLPAATGAGIYPVFGDTADTLIPMVATRDIGTTAAQLLCSPPAHSEVIDLDAPAYTERQVAAKLGDALGRALQVVTIPRAGWLDAMVDAGVPPSLAAELVQLLDADHGGLLQPCGDRRVRCETTLDDTLRGIVAARADSPAPTA